MAITSGSGTCAITATKAADADYSAATSAPATLLPSPRQPRRSARSALRPAVLGIGTTTTASATATSGLTPIFTSTTPTVCTVSGSTVTGIAAGTCIIAANQAGDGNYSAAVQTTQSVTPDTIKTDPYRINAT